MARAKRPTSKRKSKRKAKRSDAEYIASAKNLASLVPSLRPLSKRKRLRPAEKTKITKREKQLKGIPDIFPLTPKQARKMRGQTLFKGVQGIQLRGVQPGSKIKYKGKSLTVTEPSGRKWLYWHLSRSTVRSKRKLKSAGQRAFQQQFPIEIVADLAARAFKTEQVVQVNLWAHAGIVGDPHFTLDEFVRWVNEKWSAGRYLRTSIHGGDSDPGKWVNGIAILLEDEEYARKRAEAIERNKNVEAELEAAGRAHRAKERKRLIKSGYLKPEKKTAKKAAKKVKKPVAKRKRKKGK